MAVTILGNKKLQVELLADESTKTQLNEIQQEVGGLNEAVDALLDDGVIQGVIASDIENKLNAKEQEYAPRLTTVESDVQFTSPFTLNVKERVPRPVITFIDDDGHKDVYTRLMPIFRDKGLGFGSAIITDYIDNSTAYMTLVQLQECHQNGLETLSHCVNVSTNLTDGYTDEQIDYQLIESKNWLKDNGFEYESIVYPQNGHNLNVRKRAKAVYKYAFGENGLNDNGYLDHSRIKRVALGSWTDSNPEINGNAEKNTLNYYKACVDYAISNNIWLVFMLHIGQQALSQDVILADLLDYIATTSVVVLTPSEAFKLKSNKLSLGDLEEEYLFIGEKKSYTNISAYKNVTGVTNDTPITDFQVGVVSKTDIVSSDSAGLPASSGVLETHRGRTDWTSFQLFQAGATHIVYKRYWNMATSLWDAWAILNPLKSLPDDAVTIDASRQAYTDGVISKCKITVAAGTPSNRVGILTTDRTGKNNSYIYQTYEPAGKTNVFKRYWDIGINNWSTWEEITPAYLVKPLNFLLASDLISSYENNKVTIFAVDSSGATGFPNNKAGLVITNKINNNGYYNQEYKQYLSNLIYNRYVLLDGTWSDWELVNIIKVLPQNTVDMNSPRRSFEVGTISKCLITITTNTPENQQGILTTERLTPTNYFIYQTFEITESQNVYRRYWINATNSWSEWLRVGGGSGATANRPTSPYNGYCYFDETLNKPVWFDGTTWVDATGTNA